MGLLRPATAWILIAVTVLLVVWDIYVSVASPPDTISLVLLDWSGSHPVIVFVAGALAGHVLWPQRR